MANQFLEQLARKEAVRENLAALRDNLQENPVSIKKDPNYSLSLWKDLLQNEDPKVRKNAATVIGMLEEPELAADLMEAYRTEQTLFVRSSYLKALGKYQAETYTEELQERLADIERSEIPEADAKHIAEELRELRRILPQAKAVRHSYRQPGQPVMVYLTCPLEVRDLLSEAVKEVTTEDTKVWGSGVLAKTARIEKLANIRIYQDMLFPLNGGKSCAKESLVRDLLQGNLFQLLGVLHASSDNPYRFRIYTRTLDAARIGGKLEASSKGKLVNSISDYEIEIRLIEKKDGGILSFLKLYTRKDDRFAYRKNVVATSMNPVRAAIVARIAGQYGKADAQILDPYCGVATLLIERDKAKAAGHLYGTDIFGDAIKSGRENAELAATTVPVHLIHRDYYDFTHEYPFDEILTQFPDFAKEEADENYRRFFAQSVTLMKKGGFLFADSSERGLIHKYLRLHKDELRLVREVLLQQKKDEVLYIIERI